VKTNLMVFLRPVIVRDAAAAAAGYIRAATIFLASRSGSPHHSVAGCPRPMLRYDFGRGLEGPESQRPRRDRHSQNKRFTHSPAPRVLATPDAGAVCHGAAEYPPRPGRVAAHFRNPFQ
jgi:hypothetical protein